MDAFINAKVLLLKGEESKAYEGNNLVRAKVIWYFYDEDSNIMSNTNIHLQFNTRMYEVEFPDDELRLSTANVIADNIWAQVNPDGQSYVIFVLIIAHHVDNSIVVSKENMYCFVNGRRTMWDIKHQTKSDQTMLELLLGIVSLLL